MAAAARARWRLLALPLALLLATGSPRGLDAAPKPPVPKAISVLCQTDEGPTSPGISFRLLFETIQDSISSLQRELLYRHYEELKGEEQKKLDMLSNEVSVNALGSSRRTRSHEEEESRCVGRKRKGRSQARRFRDCISLVHHARDVNHCGRPLAHRALAAVVCRVLGWDVKRLPSLVIDPRDTLGQALLAREGASAAAQEAKDNVDAGEKDHKDAAKEDVGLEKNGSLTHDKKVRLRLSVVLIYRKGSKDSQKLMRSQMNL
ncbi:hypothetical protein D1007_04270 [Hordeum vulgare]|nr:hypothetical protein D1007_04270 [Hordeum vulgare]